MSEDEPEEESPRPASVRGDASRDTGDEVGAPPPSLAKAPRPELPVFALAFPSDPALDELVAAFEQGNYARVRREAPMLAKRTTRPEVRRAARELARRLAPDPIAVYLLSAAALLLVFLALWYWTHPHEAP